MFYIKLFQFSKFCCRFLHAVARENTPPLAKLFYTSCSRQHSKTCFWFATNGRSTLSIPVNAMCEFMNAPCVCHLTSVVTSLY